MKRYEIDGREVTDAEFEQLFRRLRQCSRGWYCAETNDGGAVGYPMRKWWSFRASYDYRAISSSTGEALSLRRR